MVQRSESVSEEVGNLHFEAKGLFGHPLKLKGFESIYPPDDSWRVSFRFSDESCLNRKINHVW